MPDYRTYNVRRRDREPLLRFITDALEASDCTIIKASEPTQAPFRVSFQSPHGVRMGIVAYAFLANQKVTKNRPEDEWRFQVKYGSKTPELHQIWDDPFHLYTTLFLGINPAEGFFVGADPNLNNPTRFFISKEFKERHVEEIQEHGWATWERDRRRDEVGPAEVMVGGVASSLLRYVVFEQEVRGEDQGTRQLVAERFREGVPPGLAGWWMHPEMKVSPDPAGVRALVDELQLPEQEILELIQQAPRLKMAVRGWVAERHLVDRLRHIPGVTECEPIEADGKADIQLRFRGRGPLYVECKNVLRQTYADGVPRLDFQRTRASKVDPCSRYYAPSDFHVVAACLHSITESWEYRGRATRVMESHPTCRGKLHHRVRIGDEWTANLEEVLKQASGA